MALQWGSLLGEEHSRNNMYDQFRAKSLVAVDIPQGGAHPRKTSKNCVWTGEINPLQR